MNFFKKYTTPFGYVADGNPVDAYGVNHSGFSTRDELEYQFARFSREKQLADVLRQHGIPQQDYPQLGIGFWQNHPQNNDDVESYEIATNVENRPNQTPLNNKDDTFMTLWDKSEYQSNNNQTTSQPFQTKIPDMSKPFTPYPLKKANITLFSEGYKNRPEWHEEKKPEFSENELLDRILPVIKKMEKPLDHIYIDTTWNKTTGAGANVDDWNTFNQINWQINGRMATDAEKRAAFNYFDAITSKGKSNIDRDGKLIKKNNNLASSYKKKSKLKISSNEIERLLRNHLAKDIIYLQKEFPDFETFPPELQNVILDIKFNTGNVSAKNWPKLRQAIADKNLFGEEGILNNIHRKDVGKDRNFWAEQQIRNIKSW